RRDSGCRVRTGARGRHSVQRGRWSAAGLRRGVMTMTTRSTTLPLGVISEGTLRPEDLIPAYLDALDGIRLTKAERGNLNRVRGEWRKVIRVETAGRWSEEHN